MSLPHVQPTGLDIDLRRRAIIRSATAAVHEEAPLSVIDPRGMIFDLNPSGLLTLRVRSEGTSFVLIAAQRAADGPARWRVLPLDRDEGLPGSALLRDGGAGLREVVQLSGALRCAILTHRLGRRAVLRVTAEKSGGSHLFRVAAEARSARRAQGRRRAVAPASAEPPQRLRNSRLVCRVTARPRSALGETAHAVAVGDAAWVEVPKARVAGPSERLEELLRRDGAGDLGFEGSLSHERELGVQHHTRCSAGDGCRSCMGTDAPLSPDVDVESSNELLQENERVDRSHATASF